MLEFGTSGRCVRRNDGVYDNLFTFSLAMFVNKIPVMKTPVSESFALEVVSNMDCAIALHLLGRSVAIN